MPEFEIEWTERRLLWYKDRITAESKEAAEQMILDDIDGARTTCEEYFDEPDPDGFSDDFICIVDIKEIPPKQ